jgi:DNA-binding LytR/AlgR family response regulator
LKIRCLVIDDEPPARELMVSYLSRLDELEITAQFGNAIDAFTYLKSHEVDLMLLDIQLPNMTGMELIKTLRKPPRVILTTAFRDYAVEGFELAVLDYLVKPISFDRFTKAIDKYHQSPVPPAREKTPDTFQSAYMFVKVGKEQIKIMLNDILYTEGIKDYLRLVTTKGSFIIYHRMGTMEEKLPADHFARIHKSFIISLDKIVSYRNDIVHIADKSLPVGRKYRKKFQTVCFQKKMIATGLPLDKNVI